jgi:hypothetical protein
LCARWCDIRCVPGEIDDDDVRVSAGVGRLRELDGWYHCHDPRPVHHVRHEGDDVHGTRLRPRKFVRDHDDRAWPRVRVAYDGQTSGERSCGARADGAVGMVELAPQQALEHCQVWRTV